MDCTYLNYSHYTVYEEVSVFLVLSFIQIWGCLIGNYFGLPNSAYFGVHYWCRPYRGLANAEERVHINCVYRKHNNIYIIFG